MNIFLIPTRITSETVPERYFDHIKNKYSYVYLQEVTLIKNNVPHNEIYINRTLPKGTKCPQ